ncbi:hypothetical protein [Clostridioides difficile]|nr:hypothetical protein [Clostridioides difficile]
MEEKLLVNLKENSYNIFIKKNILKNIGEEIKKYILEIRFLL